MRLEHEALSADVLVVGSGAAGCMAALGAAEAGANVLLVSKGPLRLSTTQIAIGGFAAAFGHADPADNPEVHLADTLGMSDGLAEPSLARRMAEDILGVTLKLLNWGADLIRLEDGRFFQQFNQNHRYRRLIHHYDTTGPELVATFVRRLRMSPIRVLDHAMIVDVVVGNGGVVGAWGLETRSGRLLAIRCTAVVLATGGGAQIYRTNDNPPVITGDGYAIALRAGARLADMEMVEFQLGVLSPVKLRGYNPHPNALLARGGRLYNGLGERFMARFDRERLEATRNRELVCKAVALEARAGRGTRNGGAYLDLSGASSELEQLQVLPPLRRRFAAAGVDVDFQPIEMGPFAHTFLGGVVIDDRGETGIPGLLAAGETTGRVHGARRLGGNALSDALVFGAVAGRSARERTTPAAHHELEAAVADAERRLRSILEREGGAEVGSVRLELQRTMDREGMVARDGPGLLQALKTIRDLRERALPRLAIRSGDRRRALASLQDALELDNLLLTAEAVVLPALERAESRGFHYRADCPEQDDGRWRCNLFVSLKRRAIAVDHAASSPNLGGLSSAPPPTLQR